MNDFKAWINNQVTTFQTHNEYVPIGIYVLMENNQYGITFDPKPLDKVGEPSFHFFVKNLGANNPNKVFDVVNVKEVPVSEVPEEFLGQLLLIS